MSDKESSEIAPIPPNQALVRVDPKLPATNFRNSPRPGPGRKKGTANKLTKDMRQTINDAFHELGGKDYLVQVGRDNYPVFCALLAKAIPDGKATDIQQSLAAALDALKR